MPDRIGPYHILGLLGEGGMGTVYVAEMRSPVRRRVALKIIKLGMDTKRVVSRFEAERQALSMMEHTNIARVYECGATEKGQPWFAMEYVKGVPITEYCDQNRLTVQERIGLFKKVCAGIQHAHLKGVMHRDIKPNNVLVMLQDDTAIPKVIDFGLAKAVDHRLVEATIFTEQGAVIGTPEYMSPEQAGLGGLDVDTRTDVYSLGVLLYELLTGQLPFQRNELRSAGLLEMQRVIREADPPKPSTRVTTLADGGAEMARLRGLGQGELGKTLRGDLDWILMRALEKDPTRRYQSVAELSSDLGRYLKFETVLASPPDVGYRVRKFLRRYRLQVAGVAMVLLALAGGTVATWVQYRRAEEAAEVAKGRADEAERLRSEAEAAKSAAQASEQRAKAAEALALAKERDALDQAGNAERERKQADAALATAESERQRALAKEQEAVRLAEEAGREKKRVEELIAQLKPWRNSVAGPILLEQAKRALASIPLHHADALAAWLAKHAEPLVVMLGEVRLRLQELRGQATAQPGGGFQLREPDDQRLHDSLADLAGALGEFERDYVVGVRRLALADEEWGRARDAVRAADGIKASRLYATANHPQHPIDLVRQEGLLPIGMNPQTKLWEFYHLPSAEAGSTTPRSLSSLPALLRSIPRHAADGDGRIPVGPASGIVFVLIPGGTFCMGAQAVAAGEANFDADAAEDERPTRSIRVAPFFVARHELTRAQWVRLGGVEPGAGDGARPDGARAKGGSTDLRLPIHSVSFEDASWLLMRHGLALPTEAQWEYVCRAGTIEPWSAPRAELADYANLADQSAARTRAAWSFEPWTDGHALHAPVGSLRPNPWGLHDIHGNVWEWCLDTYGPFNSLTDAASAVRRSSSSDATTVYRGGGYSSAARLARSSVRSAATPKSVFEFVGLRAVRALPDRR